MPATALPLSSSPARHTSVREKLFNIFVSPADVFDEVIASPRNLANWRVPTLLVCLANVIFLQPQNSETQLTAAIRHLAETDTISAAQAQALAGAWPVLSALLICVATFAGTCWSAFIIYIIARMFLKLRVPYLQALEIVGLSGTVMALGLIMTLLLIAATGDPDARPALSFLAGKLHSRGHFYQSLQIFDFFHLWSTTVLAIGMSRLCNVTFKEAAFWVFGYWVAARIVLIILQ